MSNIASKHDPVCTSLVTTYEYELDSTLRPFLSGPRHATVLSRHTSGHVLSNQARVRMDHASSIPVTKLKLRHCLERLFVRRVLSTSLNQGRSTNYGLRCTSWCAASFVVLLPDLPQSFPKTSINKHLHLHLHQAIDDSHWTRRPTTGVHKHLPLLTPDWIRYTHPTFV